MASGSDTWPSLSPSSGDQDLDPGGVVNVATPSYSGIASINKSVRDDKNILEVRLKRTSSARFSLTMLEVEGLLKKLGIDNSHFLGVSACPEGKGVVYITLHPSVDINRFLFKNEAYIVKEGVQTSVIRPAGKKDVFVTVSGLHPNTRDQAVIRYLMAHGKVNLKDQVIHHVYPGRPGSSLLAGKLNGSRSYMVEITKSMGSFHIIDGEKVSIKYRGQIKSCARCHQLESQCPGKAIASECDAERVLLSTHMEEHWRAIGFKPDSGHSEDVDQIEPIVQVGSNKGKYKSDNLTNRYNAVIISGFQADTNIESVHKVLSDNGLPDSKTVSDLSRNDKNGKITIAELSPENCLLLIEKLHGKSFLDKKVFVTSIVSASPQKHAPNKEVPLASEVSSPATPCIEGPVGTEEIAESTAHSRSVTAPLPSVTTPSKSNFDNPETQDELSQAQTSGVNSEKKKSLKFS